MNLTLTYRCPQWIFPADRFVEYEPSDEVWCRPLGIGKEETVYVNVETSVIMTKCEAKAIMDGGVVTSMEFRSI